VLTKEIMVLIDLKLLEEELLHMDLLIQKIIFMISKSDGMMMRKQEHSSGIFKHLLQEILQLIFQMVHANVKMIAIHLTPAL